MVNLLAWGSLKVAKVPKLGVFDALKFLDIKLKHFFQSKEITFGLGG